MRLTELKGCWPTFPVELEVSELFKFGYIYKEGSEIHWTPVTRKLPADNFILPNSSLVTLDDLLS